MSSINNLWRLMEKLEKEMTNKKNVNICHCCPQVFFFAARISINSKSHYTDDDNDDGLRHENALNFDVVHSLRRGSQPIIWFIRKAGEHHHNGRSVQWHFTGFILFSLRTEETKNPKPVKCYDFMWYGTLQTVKYNWIALIMIAMVPVECDTYILCDVFLNYRYLFLWVVVT